MTFIDWNLSDTTSVIQDFCMNQDFSFLSFSVVETQKVGHVVNDNISSHPHLSIKDVNNLTQIIRVLIFSLKPSFILFCVIYYLFIIFEYL